MGADSPAKNTTNGPNIYMPNLSAQAQKFWISIKKASLGVRIPWSGLCCQTTKSTFHPANLTDLTTDSKVFYSLFEWNMTCFSNLFLETWSYESNCLFKIQAPVCAGMH